MVVQFYAGWIHSLLQQMQESGRRILSAGKGH